MRNRTKEYPSRRSKLRRLLVTGVQLTCISALLGLMVAPAHAQYFGRSKVQYADLDFRVLETDNFDIYYYPEAENSVRRAARMAERWYARLSRVLDCTFPDRQPLILYANHPHFRQTNTILGFLGESTGGVTESRKRRVVMPFAAGLGKTDHVLGHELVHAFQYAIGAAGSPRVGRLPLWFIEGMAESGASCGPRAAPATPPGRSRASSGSTQERSRKTGTGPSRTGCRPSSGPPLRRRGSQRR